MRYTSDPRINPATPIKIWILFILFGVAAPNFIDPYLLLVNLHCACRQYMDLGSPIYSWHETMFANDKTDVLWANQQKDLSSWCLLLPLQCSVSRNLLRTCMSAKTAFVSVAISCEPEGEAIFLFRGPDRANFKGFYW